MNSIDRLTELFKSFPGIGPRQAKRFVYYLLSHNGSYSDELVEAIQDLKKEVAQCESCQIHFIGNQKLCSICSDENRDASLLMLVPRDIDLEAMEKSGSYHGFYFVLGGVVPILDKEPEKRIRIKDLGFRIQEGIKMGLKEIILAMNVNQDGEHTAEFIKEKIREWQGSTLTISELGRGLSTGIELEYADSETLKNALLHRTK